MYYDQRRRHMFARQNDIFNQGVKRIAVRYFFKRGEMVCYGIMADIKM